jgi:hypothetical protein
MVKSYGSQTANGDEMKSMTGGELEDLAFLHMPEDFFRRATQAVFTAHKVSWDECTASFAETEARNVQPYSKRGKLEGYLRDISAMFPGMTSDVIRAEQSNWFHSEIRSGPVVLTESSVPTPCALVERAEFRLTLARSAQGVLFDDEDQDVSSALYLLLLHSRSVWPDSESYRKYRHLPGSAYVAFPSPSLDGYVHQFNLFTRFPDVVEAHLPQEWDSEARIRYRNNARWVASG